MSKELFKKRSGVQGYLSVGKDFLDYERFVPIENTDTIKPRGGLWATTHDINSICYNEWMDYLTEHPHLIFYKYKGCDIPTIFFTLKEDAKIITIDSTDIIDNLKINYPDFNGNIDYSLLSSECDGIYIDVRQLSHEKQNMEYIKQFCINTLLLFNLDCIKDYQQGMIYVEIDDRFRCETIEYNIIIKKKNYNLENSKLIRKRR